jgi:hypothetical protein
LLVTLCLLAVAAALAQTTLATITGTVTDASGAVLPNATVTATHADTGFKYTAKTNDAGVYTLSQLREGTYEVRITAEGFNETVLKHVQLVSRDVRRLDAGLQIGSVTTSVEVTAGATLIETETGRISATKSAYELKTLPLNTRSLNAFFATIPGMGEASTVTATRRFSGSRRNQSDIAVDGISITASNGTQITPLMQYVESFQEVRIDTANNTAENATVGAVTIVSKGGTNELHGSAFDYYVTPFFRARDPFEAQRGTGISHSPGFSVGGPVVLPKVYNGRNRTFFFTSFETSRGSVRTQNLNPTVPLEAWRRGDFSALLPGTVIRDPFNNNQPFSGNRIPAERLNATSLKIQNRFYPLPNFGNTSVLASNNYREQKVRDFDPNTYFTTRVDRRLPDDSTLYGRYTWQRSRTLEFTGNLPTIGQQWRERNTRNALLSYTKALRPTLLNEARWGVSFTNEPRFGPIKGLENVRELGLTGFRPDLPDLPGVFNMGFTGLGLTGVTQQVYSAPAFYNLTNFVQDHISWFHGRHSIKAGFMLTHAKAGDLSASNDLYGNMTFSNRFTNHPYADFLLGLPTTARRAAPPVEDLFTRRAYDFFITDEIKVTPKLTVSAGVRYEIHPAWSPISGNAAIFDIGTGRVVVADGSLSRVSPLVPAGYLDIVEASSAGLPGKSLLFTDKNNFAPRLSIAYRPWGNSTVIRAGFGIFYDLVPRRVSTNASPFVVNEPAYTNPSPNPTVILPLIFPSTGSGLPTTVGLPGAVRTGIQIPYSMQYNFTIEHERWKNGFRLSYIGTNTRQGEYNYNINSPAPDTRAYIDKPRPFPKYPGINYTTNGAGHQYNALNAEVHRRFASGLLYDFTYVWARDIGDLERDQAQENPFDRRRERGVWEDIPSQRFTGDFVYELPFGRGKKWLGATRVHDLVFGGWELSGVFGAQTGYFLTPLWTGPDPTGTAQTSSRTPANVTIRPNVIRNPNLPESQRTIDRWFDVNAFTAPTSGSFGSAAKGIIVGPGSWNINTGVAKNIALTERLRLRWEITATNIANHPNWNNPGLNISTAASAGVITGAGDNTGFDQAGARTFRTGLRVEW